MAPFRLRLVLAAASFVAVGCGEEALFPGGKPGSPIAIAFSQSRFALRAGEGVTLGFEARDAVGNPVPAASTAVASCDEAVVAIDAAGDAAHWLTTARLTAVAPGRACVDVSVDALRAAVEVDVGVGSLVIVGPDTIRSGGEATYAFAYYDVNGDEVVPSPGFVPPALVSGAPDLLTVSPRADGRLRVESRGLGSATLQARTRGASASKRIAVPAALFTGSVRSPSGEPISSAGFADTLVITPGAVPLSGAEVVTIGGAAPWLVRGDATEIVLLVPALPLGPAELLITGMGTSGGVARGAVITIDSTFSNTFPGPDLSAGPFPLEFFVNLTGAKPDAYYTFDRTGAPSLDLTATLEWRDPPFANLDVLWHECTSGGSVGNLDGAGYDRPEQSTVTVPAGACWVMVLHMRQLDPMAKVTLTSP